MKDFYINKKKTIEFIILLAILTVVGFGWYRNGRWSVLMGDDLIAVYGFKTLGFWGNLFNMTDISMGKIRPVQKTILWIAYVICDTDYKKYILLSKIALVLVAFCIYIMVRKMNIDVMKSAAISTLIITCPFSAYGAWQYIGITESFSLLCCIAYGFFSYKILYEKDKKKCHWYVLINTVLFTVLIFNAERFMYLVAALGIIIIIKKELRWTEKTIYLIYSVSPIVFRSVVLHFLGSVALGTGRSGIGELVRTLVPYAIRGYINMLGFSIGDEWHGGFTFTSISPIILVLSSIRVFIFIGILYSSVKSYIYTWENKHLEIVMWYLFSLTSLFSYALVGQTHGEDRFLWIPYIFYLIALMRYAELEEIDFKCSFKNKTIVNICLMIFTLFVTMSNYYYLENKVHVHFRYSQEMAETAIESVKELKDYENIEQVVCINSNDYQWVFYGESFFHFYLNEKCTVYYYSTYDDFILDRGQFGDNTVIVCPDPDYPIPYGTQALWLGDYLQQFN